MDENLYIVTYEPGFGPEPLPLWTDQPGEFNPFDSSPSEPATRINVPEVPGAFQLLNVLSQHEADNIVIMAEKLGFHQDSPVSLPYEIRHNGNMNWVVSDFIDAEIWKRSKELITESFNSKSAKGLNARFRFYRYGIGDFFKLHTDGSWPGSRVKNGHLVQDAFPELRSQYTYLIFLNDGYEGGRTQFFVSKSDPKKPAKLQDDVNEISISTPKGAALCFPHGTHPLHCLHAGEEITSGTKYIIRTDILFG
jgi:hypothetical protein